MKERVLPFESLGLTRWGIPGSPESTSLFHRKQSPERRTSKKRRTKDRRRLNSSLYLKRNPERRSGRHRRSGQDRRRSLRVPIFVKLTALSIILIVLVVSATGYIILKKQEKQFVGQLVNLGEGMIHFAVNNTPEKLLGEEDLALFQLVNNIVENEQVVYALVTDRNNMIKAHSSIEAVNEAYVPPENIAPLLENNDVKVSSFVHEGEKLLFFEQPVTYQKLRVGAVRLAISQKEILENINDAKSSIIFLATILIFLTILLSFGLSMYISQPINKLRESAKALGRGDFDHRICIKRKDEFGDLGLAFNKMAEDLALKEKIKDSFGRYVTPEIVDLVLANPDSHWMKGSRLEATVLFVDIRGFTAISENKEPEKIVEMLNDFFGRVTDIVIKYDGYLNKFVGDEAMAVFGTPKHNPEHAEAAVNAALEIQKEIGMLNQEKERKGDPFHVGIGINSGEMVAGNLGSARRVEYTVIGDNVNVSARLTSLARGTEILISRETHDLIAKKSLLRVEERGKIPVKGRKREITVLNVLGFKEESNVDDEQTAI